MNYSQIAILFLQAVLIAFTILLLFRLRNKLGNGPLFACLGLFQFVQVFLSSTVYLSITDTLLVSPGSSVFFTGTLFAILIIYIKEDAGETKRIIYALFVVNLIMAVLLQTFGWNLKDLTTYNPLNLSTSLFDISARVIFVGGVALILDSILIIVIFEFISRHLKFLFLRIILTMLIVVAFDTFFFSIITFWNLEKLQSIVTSALISKGVFALFYSIIFYVYLRYIDSNMPIKQIFKIKDVFQSLSYKQKFKEVSDDIKRAEEMYRLLADNSSDVICLHENDSTFKYVSPSIKTILGYEDSEIIGKLDFDLIHKEDVSFFEESIQQRVLNKVENDAFVCRGIHKEGHVIWLEFTASLVYLDDKTNYILTSARDITERILAEKEIKNTLELLEKSEYSKNEASKMAKIGYWEHDFVTNTAKWSDYMYFIFESNPDDEVPNQEHILKNLTKKSQERFKNSTTKLISEGISYDIELKYINSKKEEIWIRNIGQPIYDNQNKIIGKRGVLQNITDQKNKKKDIDQKNEKLYELNKALNEAQKLSHVGSWSWNMKTDEAEWSDEMYNIYGVTKENFYPSNANVTKTVLPEDLHKIEAGIGSLLIDKMFVPFDFRIVRPTGEIRHLHIVALEKNTEESIFGVTKDITESKKIEEESLRLKDNYERLFDNATVSIWNEDFSYFLKEIEELKKTNISDINLYLEENSEVLFSLLEKIKVNKVNKATLKLFEAKNKEIFLNNVPETFGTGASKVFRDFVTSTWNNETSFTSEINYKTLKGVEFAAIVSIPIPQTEIEQLTVPVIIQSIQSIKDAENAKERTIKELERSEFLFNESSKLAKIGAWELELPSQKIRWSKQIFEIHGIPVGQVPPLEECLSFYIDGSAEKLAKAIEKGISEKKKYDLIVRFKNKQNKKLWINTIGYPLTNKEGEVTSLIGVFHDITEQRTRQNELDTQNEELFKLNNALNESQEIAQVGSWMFNVLSKESEWSEETFRIWGFDYKKGAPEGDDIINRIHIDDRELFNKSADIAHSIGTPYDIEFRICLPNDIQKTLRSICKPIFDTDGKVIALRGTNQDITEQKRIRSEIEKAEEMYRLITDNSNDLICLHESDSSFTYISPSVKNLLGYNPSDFLGKKVYSLVHEDDIEPFKKAMGKEVFSNIDNLAYTFRVRHKKGHFIWLEFLAAPVYKENKISYYVTIARDITQWVKAKQEIQEYQTSLQEMTTEMTLIEEKQKKEIASNIHDHLSQSLVISKMKINELKKNPQLKIIDEDLKFVEANISEALENSRKITYELSPPVLYQLGIIDALNWLLENTETTHNIKCKIISNVNNVNLDDVKSILLYRCIQEVVKNAVKYAKASLFTLEIDKNATGLSINFKDNGVGFDTSY